MFKSRGFALFISSAIATSFLLGGCGFLGRKAEQPPESVATHKIVASAYSQVGKRYRSGGDSPKKGFDCSGLVWWSYKQNGIKVPRISRDQARAGRKVPKKAARPGDIVVFKTSHSPNGLHTGIYAGKEKFIHSPSSGKAVCLEDMTAPYWNNKLYSIRRVGR